MKLHCNYIENLVCNVEATKKVSYKIAETSDLFSLGNNTLINWNGPISSSLKKALVVIDKNVFQIYGKKIKAYFEYFRVNAEILIIEVTESCKEIDLTLDVVRQMSKFSLARRSEPLIVIGGGILLDICSLAACLYRRGIPLIKIPTTLMAIVDAGIGVKNGVNFNNKKNLVGTYYEFQMVLLDLMFLKTLDDRHITNGIAEIIKIALIKNRHLFELLERNMNAIVKDKLQGKNEYKNIIHMAINDMLAELSPNLWEKELSRIVDYGHTFSPKIEMEALPALLHGEAVAIDIAISLALSKNRNLINSNELYRSLKMLYKFGLVKSSNLPGSLLLYDALKETMVHRDGKQLCPLTKGLGGHVFVDNITYSEITDAAYLSKACFSKLENNSEI